MPSAVSWVPAIASVGALVALYTRFVARLTRIEFKINTVWDFLIRRAHVELLLSNAAEMHSAVTVTPPMRAVLAPVVTKILPFYHSTLRERPLREQFVLLEQGFGNFLAEQVCVPQKLGMDACLIAVLTECHARDATQ